MQLYRSKRVTSRGLLRFVCRNQLLVGGESADLDYLMALVDLLATCAEVTPTPVSCFTLPIYYWCFKQNRAVFTLLFAIETWGAYFDP